MEALQIIERQSEYNLATATLVEDNLYLLEPMEGDLSILASKEVYEKMFSNNSFPLFTDNNTPYYRYKALMNKEGFIKENMLRILNELNFVYKPDTFYADAEKFVKTLSIEDKIKFIIPIQYFMGEDFRKISPEAEWEFNIRCYFQPFFEPCLYYKTYNFDFYDINLLLREKLFKDRNITFKTIIKKENFRFLRGFPVFIFIGHKILSYS
ncbi:hypothetical protein VUJ46_15925 [Chryseobacterium sp. MYb264]|uniref:hypothetical protein n=1 Tax=Chryseobacterium sp. MYb264 TaxID=2745153 RepID=UPI002E1369B3|nr:hypothetical protein VUJ46_15925 [Chryseobacterium sp. MYb264]